MLSNHLNRVKTVLCIGAHPDDIEIGCGGTLLRIDELADVKFVWAVFSGDEERRREAQLSSTEWLTNNKSCVLEQYAYEDGLFPSSFASIKKDMLHLDATYQPEMIFTHYLTDRHQDHRILSEITWQTFRKHFVLEYEIPKYEGDLGHPNLFVEISRNQLDRKIEGLMQYYPSQSTKHWFDAETFRGCARLRGIECASTYAEAFHVRKLILR